MKKFRRILALLLVLCMLPVGRVMAHPFRDVPDGAWYEPYVQFVYDNGLMSGISGTEFGPALPMNRAMVVTVLYRMAGSPQVSGAAPFTDVQPGAFYEKPVAWAYENGIVMGVSATEFAPGADVLRCQLVTFFYRYAKALGHDTSARTDLSAYLDRGQVMDFAADAFSWAVAEGIISGMSATELGPNGTANRAQCAAIIMRAVQNVIADYELSLDRSNAELTVGDTLALNVTYTGDKPLTWTSSKRLVAIVDQNGIVTAYNDGIAYITVDDGIKSATCRIKVDKVPEDITIIPPDDQVFLVGKTYQFSAKVNDTVIASEPLVWKTSNESVATIDQNGLLTALTKGFCSVEASCGNHSALYGITVDALVNEIVIGYTDGPFYDGVTRYADDYVVVTAVNQPNEATRTITVKSSDPDVVEVGGIIKNGNSRDITLNFKSAGTATITLQSGDGAVSQSYTITIKDGYDFDPGDRQLTPEEFADYTTKVMCANGFTYDYTCTSWEQLTRTYTELSFEQAKNDAYAMIHSLWPIGRRYCKIVYIGQDANGDYVFHTCWG